MTEQEIQEKLLAKVNRMECELMHQFRNLLIVTFAKENPTVGEIAILNGKLAARFMGCGSAIMSKSPELLEEFWNSFWISAGDFAKQQAAFLWAKKEETNP